MAATSMPSINSLAETILADHNDLSFCIGPDFAWSATTQTITHPPINSRHQLYQLLHEIGHARLAHQAYRRDAELIDLERAAWQYACDILAPRYNLPLSADTAIVQDSLDTYREWLHMRSRCPSCQAVGIEAAPARYRCLHCQQQWHVNEARICRLKRTSLPNT